jgi:hypothetical protein
MDQEDIMLSDQKRRGHLMSIFNAYFRENWGAPFILGFIALIIVCAVLQLDGLPDSANSVAVYAYYLLVIGVILQIVSYIRDRNIGREKVSEK